MLEDVLSTISSLSMVAPEVSTIPADRLPLPFILCAVGALILGKFTGSLGNLTMAINYSALFLGAMFSTWFLGSLELPIDQGLGQPLLVTLIGMLIGAFGMLYWFQDSRSHA